MLCYITADKLLLTLALVLLLALLKKVNFALSFPWNFFELISYLGYSPSFHLAN